MTGEKRSWKTNILDFYDRVSPGSDKKGWWEDCKIYRSDRKGLTEGNNDGIWNRGAELQEKFREYKFACNGRGKKK